MYNTVNYNVTQTQVVLDKANFKVVGTVEGVAKTTSFLGISDLSDESLKGNAVADMYKRANLKGAQTIVNVNFKRSYTVEFLLEMVEYTASGLIIEFVNDSEGLKQIDDTSICVENAEESVSIQAEEDSTCVENAEEFEPIQPEEDSTLRIGSLIEYNGLVATVCQIRDSVVVLVASGDHSGTWDEAMEYCNQLEGDWKLPTVDEFKSMKLYRINIPNNGVDGYWTRDEKNEKRAMYFDLTYKTDYSILKNKRLHTIVVARVNIDDLIKTQ